VRKYIKITAIELNKSKAVVRIEEQSHRDFTWVSKRHPGCSLKSDCWPDLMTISATDKKFLFYLRGSDPNRDTRDVWMERWVYDILADMISEYNGVSEERFLLDERLFEI